MMVKNARKKLKGRPHSSAIQMSKPALWNELRHNGIYVPEPYRARGIPLRYRGREYYLDDEGELMALHLAARLEKHIDDEVFLRNFMKDFRRRLPKELRDVDLRELDLSEFRRAVEQDRALAPKRRSKRELEELKRRYSYALVDGRRYRLSVWKVEAPGIFIGRGNHPLRGRWKRQVTERDIVLNLDPGAPVPPGKWKGVVHRPDVLWVATWKDPLTGKDKYVWFHETTDIMQARNKKKYDVALRLGERIDLVRERIFRGMSSRNEMTRKVATVAYLIDSLCMRVGDEKDSDEADTVGATTLRVEHVKIEGNEVRFRFLGKDSVLWEKTIVNPPEAFLKNLKEFISRSRTGQIFEGVNSRKVNEFLGRTVKGLTAKVFRTYHGTLTFFSYLDRVAGEVKDPVDAEHQLKVANLMAAVRLNHKRTPPANYQESLKRKRERLIGLLMHPPKRVSEAYINRIRRLESQVIVQEMVRDYNLNTSLKNYIDPRVVYAWCRMTGLPVERAYSSSLRKKFRWARSLDVSWEDLKETLSTRSWSGPEGLLVKEGSGLQLQIA